MERPYHTIRKNDAKALACFLTKNGQALLPMVELIEQSKLAVDELIDVLGRASIEAVLRLSAEAVARTPPMRLNMEELWRGFGRLARPGWGKVTGCRWQVAGGRKRAK